MVGGDGTSVQWSLFVLRRGLIYGVKESCMRA